MTRPRLLFVSPRPPRQDGQGDQRRAHYAVTALSDEWEVDVISWLPDADEPQRRWQVTPRQIVRAMALAAVRPLHVAYVQAMAPASLAQRMAGYDMTLFVTDRAVPRRCSGRFVVDFIDDLGGAAAQRATGQNPLLGSLWRLESRRLRRFDAQLAEKAVLSMAVNSQDAAAISAEVTTIPPAIGTHPTPEAGTKVVFTGNLFYGPNAEAASWICTSLAPRLEALGVGPEAIVIAGRRPTTSLRAQAEAAGVDLRADVADLTAVLDEAAVVLGPVVFGSGTQNKILDAVGAGRACVVSPFTNKVLGLVDGRSALVVDRTVDGFAGAIVTLLGNPALRGRLAASALEQFAPFMEDAVLAAWGSCFRTVGELLQSGGDEGVSGQEGGSGPGRPAPPHSTGASPGSRSTKPSS